MIAAPLGHICWGYRLSWPEHPVVKAAPAGSHAHPRHSIWRTWPSHVFSTCEMRLSFKLDSACHLTFSRETATEESTHSHPTRIPGRLTLRLNNIVFGRGLCLLRLRCIQPPKGSGPETRRLVLCALGLPVQTRQTLTRSLTDPTWETAAATQLK